MVALVSPGTGDRRGVVLVTVLLLLLATTLLVNGSLLLARSFRRGGDEAWDATRVRRAVGGRVDLAAGRGDTVAMGWRASGPGVDARVDVLALTPELRLLAGAGRGGRARWWAGRLLWYADPDARGRAVQAGVRAGGGVQVGASATVSPSAGGCLVDGGVRATAPLATPLAVGPLDPTAFQARVPPWIPAAAPASCPSGGCDPVVGAISGGAVVSHGVHTGVFLVRGDLVLSGTADVQGHLLVEGRLVLQDGAGVRGAVDATGPVLVSGSATVVADPCAVASVWRRGARDLVGGVALERRAWPLWGPPP